MRPGTRPHATSFSNLRCESARPGGTIAKRGCGMLQFSPADFIALGYFVAVWGAYAVLLEWTPYGGTGLNSRMDRYREAWMRQMLARNVRIVDTQILAALQNGTAFFASTSLISIGGALTLLRSGDDIVVVVGALPFGVASTQVQWEAKALGLALVFVYAL